MISPALCPFFQAVCALPSYDFLRRYNSRGRRLYEPPADSCPVTDGKQVLYLGFEAVRQLDLHRTKLDFHTIKKCVPGVDARSYPVNNFEHLQHIGQIT